MRHRFPLLALALFAAAVVLGIGAGRTWAPPALVVGARAPDPASPTPGRWIAPEDQVSDLLPPDAPPRVENSPRWQEADAQAPPAPTDPPPRSTPPAEPPPGAPRGIVQERQSPFHQTVNVRNQWQDLVGATWVNVTAGALVENARQGILVVSSCPGGSTAFGWQIDRYPTPRREGAVRIVAADGPRLTLQAETGATFVFDVAERKYLATSAPAPAPATPRPTATLLSPPTPATAEPAAGAADEGPRMCTVAALGAVFEGRTAPHDGWLAGHVLFTNRAAAACILYGWPQQVDLVDARGGVLPVERGPNGDRGPDSGFLLAPGRSAHVEVWWWNWCQPAPEGPLSLAVSPSEGGGGRLAMPVEGNAPPCIQPGRPSLLLVGPFQRWE